MATHDVDQKTLARLAKEASTSSLLLGSNLYKILGLSVLLSRRLIRARRLRKLDTSRDTKSLELYQHIIWLSREGLSLTERQILPSTDEGQHGPELRAFAAKLRASFYHVFCLFQNHPPVSLLSPTPYASPELAKQTAVTVNPTHDGNQQMGRAPTSKNGYDNNKDKHTATDRRSLPIPRDRRAALRDAIPSMTSEASYITNPYAAVSPPPGLPSRIPDPSAFLLPVMDFLPITTTAFNNAASIATAFLPGSSALRLSIALEYCAFLWDCLHDHEGSRRMARQAISEVYRAKEGMDDSEFDDSVILVGTLGRMMRRNSLDATPKLGETSPRTAGVHDPRLLSPIQNMPASVVPLRHGGPQQSLEKERMATTTTTSSRGQEARNIDSPTAGRKNDTTPSARAAYGEEYSSKQLPSVPSPRDNAVNTRSSGEGDKKRRDLQAGALSVSPTLLSTRGGNGRNGANDNDERPPGAEQQAAGSMMTRARPVTRRKEGESSSNVIGAEPELATANWERRAGPYRDINHNVARERRNEGSRAADDRDAGNTVGGQRWSEDRRTRAAAGRGGY